MIETPFLKALKMWHSRTWINGGLGRAGLVAGFHDLKGLFQPNQFYDSKPSHSVLEIICEMQERTLS